MDGSKGLVVLTLSTIPEKKKFTLDNGNSGEFWELTLSDGRNIHTISGDSGYDFSVLDVGKTYAFAIVPRLKNCNAVAKNGNTYSKKYTDFKIIGVYNKVDLAKFEDFVSSK